MARKYLSFQYIAPGQNFMKHTFLVTKLFNLGIETRVYQCHLAPRQKVAKNLSLF